APGTLPPTRYEIEIEYTLFKRVVGLSEEVPVAPVREGEQLVLNIYSAVTSGVVRKRTSDKMELQLRRPIVAAEGDKIAISRIIGSAWRLIGYGEVA
ncbi:MAG TPA: translation initiation factor IF-2 subunit gamma, partial [Nitrososphaeria archaeon]|nr:translation initiation factor IF-2 subunit gamma [Nitrososphaeria archaeon]